MLQCLSITDINKRNYANACDALIVLFGLISESNDKERIKKLITEICEKNLKSDSSYDIRASLKVLNKFNQFESVCDFQLPLSMKNDPWILYWIANAKLQLCKIDAVDTINHAIENIEAISTDYLSTFYQCQGKCYLLISDKENARIAFENAIKHCIKEKFKASLQKQLDQIINE